MLSKVRHYLPQEQIISVYHAIFSSHLSYGCQIWGQNEKSSLFKKISNLQKRALRIISFSRYDCPSEPIFKYYKILKLKDQISLYNCLLIHDYSRNLLPSSFDTFFTLCTELHNNDTRRQAGCVFVPHYNSNRYGRQSIKLSCILNWNHLSEVLNQNLLSLTKPNLKKSITQYFLSTYSN